MEKRRGQNTADAAAAAGMFALAAGQDVLKNGYAVATAMGYSSGVSLNSITLNGTPGVQAVVTTSFTPLFSGMFLSGPVTISESAVAAVAPTGPVCMLALEGAITFEPGSNVQANGCTFASNWVNAGAMFLDASSLMRVSQAPVSSGGCSVQCEALTPEPLTYQLPTPDPFASTIGVVALPNRTSAPCSSIPVPYESTGKIDCNDFTVASGSAPDLPPGTYFFDDSNIVVLTGGTLSGVGVTIIMTGSSPGAIDVQAGATVNLAAPDTSGFDPAFNGVLFYTDKTAAVNLRGSGSTFSGVMYFPSSAVTFTGGSSGCSEIIAGSLSLTGISEFSASGCPAVAQAQAVRIVQ